MKTKEFASFYDQNINKIYRFILLKVNSKETAQDLTSEAFLRLLNCLNQGKKIDNPRAFLYQIARNLTVDFYREKALSPLPLEEARLLINEKDESPDIKAVLASDIKMVKNALGQLDSEYADIITWHYLDDLPMQEIGQILGRPEGTVRVMLSRGLKELRGKIKQ